MSIDKELLRWRDQGETVQTSHGKLFVRAAGQGPALLMVHGFPTSSWDWHQLAPLLEPSFNVITIDMLGYGFSDKPRNQVYSTKLQVELIDQVLQRMSISSIHVMSYSYGVSVVQEMLAHRQAETFSADIASLCFMNGGLFPSSNHPNLSQKLMLGRLGWLFVYLMNKRSLEKNLRSIFGPNTQPGKALIEQYWGLINFNNGRSTLPKLIQYLNERQSHMHRWEVALKQADCPTQLIIGDQDSISGTEVADEFCAKISQDNVEILKNIGHYPQLEAPKDVFDLYTTFVNGFS